MTDLIARTFQVIRNAGADIQPGLTDAEVARIESTFGFRFADDHRRFLMTGLPTKDRWVDWRGDLERIRRRMEWPIEGIIFDVLENGFWPGSWGERPGDASDAESLARDRLAGWPRLVPLYSHRYIASRASGIGSPRHPSPVFSVHQTDVIIYGSDLHEYALNEFARGQFEVTDPVARVPFWLDLAEGVEPAGH